MAWLALPPLFAALVWWLSTGAVLLLVGRRERHGMAALAVLGLLLVSLAGIAFSADREDIAGAYVAFTCAVLLWGAQEIVFLTGWVTGPQPRACPAGVTGWSRLAPALGAILYHEFALLACGAAVVALTSGAPNPVALWTFGVLWVLRQSSKINLFLGVPVTNDAFMPEPVRFLKSYFRVSSPSLFFPVSVTCATVVLAMMVLRILDEATLPFPATGLSLVAALFALGIVEHWFMLFPMPALTLWAWGLPSDVPPETVIMTPIIIEGLPPAISAEAAAPATPETVPTAPAGEPLVIRAAHPEALPAKTQHDGARQRLEDLFRRRFVEERATAAGGVGIENAQAAVIKGRAS